MEEVGGTLLEYEDEQEEKERGHDTREEIVKKELNMKVIWGVI